MKCDIRENGYVIKEITDSLNNCREILKLSNNKIYILSHQLVTLSYVIYYENARIFFEKRENNVIVNNIELNTPDTIYKMVNIYPDSYKVIHTIYNLKYYYSK